MKIKIQLIDYQIFIKTLRAIEFKKLSKSHKLILFA